ncbi:DUF2505 domain-containing protein [Mycolicibacterium komossense]|jgi:hypothetical protein|uniref:DUF2505 domain-containing protein n=1 Tax=Mycolicibacterium komossense TaxID=1779 RepID=A0ABT3CLC6_9MYCO|nr:DUF2505 domain-containing protein [Mycolicibacterium komossense]MCV7230267.1 DUF2505 domain-containing protein [Mycolicibacterium komossense]
MGRRMDYTIAFDAPAEKIYRDLTSRPYWEALTDVYLALTPQAEVADFASAESGTDIVIKLFLPRSELPPMARAVLPVDLVITRVQHFDPFDTAANQATGTYRATVPAGPGHLDGRYFLTEADGGDRSQLRLASECKVHLPLVGGTLEQLILSNITTMFDAEEAFTADWITDHH